jgi:hypothetical protein
MRISSNEVNAFQFHSLYRRQLSVDMRLDAETASMK